MEALRICECVTGERISFIDELMILQIKRTNYMSKTIDVSDNVASTLFE
jgi:hypothetical protein